jgi:hypothetical protein
MRCIGLQGLASSLLLLQGSWLKVLSCLSNNTLMMCCEVNRFVIVVQINSTSNTLEETIIECVCVGG